jgi:hypothetical protein
VSVNNYRPNVCVLPEDKADESIATGFQLAINTRQYQVMPYPELPGGLKNVIRVFLETYQSLMRRYPHKNFVLLIDFDKKFPERLDEIKSKIPIDLIDRVFVIGALVEPEDLKRSLGHKSFEEIGEILAEECRANESNLWNHELLIHNQDEINRMPPIIKEILFSN